MSRLQYREYLEKNREGICGNQLKNTIPELSLITQLNSLLINQCPSYYTSNNSEIGAISIFSRENQVLFSPFGVYHARYIIPQNPFRLWQGFILDVSLCKIKRRIWVTSNCKESFFLSSIFQYVRLLMISLMNFRYRYFSRSFSRSM